MIVCEIVRTGFDVRYVLLLDERGTYQVSGKSGNELCNYRCFLSYWKLSTLLSVFKVEKVDILGKVSE